MKLSNVTAVTGVLHDEGKSIEFGATAGNISKLLANKEKINAQNKAPAPIAPPALQEANGISPDIISRVKNKKSAAVGTPTPPPVTSKTLDAERQLQASKATIEATERIERAAKTRQQQVDAQATAGAIKEAKEAAQNAGLGSKDVSMEDAIKGVTSKDMHSSFSLTLRSVEEFKSWDMRTNPLKDMDWIWQNIGLNDVDVLTAPSPGAYTYMMKLRADPDMLTEFYKLYINRRLPSRDTIEEMEERLNDDGRDLNDFLTAKIEFISKEVMGGV